MSEKTELLLKTETETTSFKFIKGTDLQGPGILTLFSDDLDENTIKYLRDAFVKQGIIPAENKIALMAMGSEDRLEVTTLQNGSVLSIEMEYPTETVAKAIHKLVTEKLGLKDILVLLLPRGEEGFIVSAGEETAAGPT